MDDGGLFEHVGKAERLQTRLLQSIFEATDRRKSVVPNWLELALHSTPEPWKELASAFQSA